MPKPILDLIEESIEDMRKRDYLCPFNCATLSSKQGCDLCKLLFPEQIGYNSRNAICPCNRLGDPYVKAIMRQFFPVKEVD